MTVSLLLANLARETSEAAEHGFECEVSGEEMADIAGTGVLAGFVGQALLSLILASIVFFLTKMGRLDVTHPEGTLAHRIQSKRMDTVTDILMIGSDLQMTLGISYLVTVFAARETMDTYHLHLVFDIASFVGVSNSAAMVCWTFCQAKIMTKDSKWGSRTGSNRVSFLSKRHRATYSFAAMYLALTVYLCVTLGHWSADAEPARCYLPGLTASPHAAHPGADITYVIVTAVWMFAVMAGSLFLGARGRRFVLIGAALQFPVHLYMAIALRHAQKGHFAGEEQTEDAWDFGQTTAVVLFAIAVVELLSKSLAYIKWERELRRNDGFDPVEAAELSRLTTEAAMEEARSASRSRHSHEARDE